MRVKKFVAKTLPDAVAQVRAELGPEAIILQTQPVKVGGIFGLFSQKMIEVTAASDNGFRLARAAAQTAPAAAADARPAPPPGAAPAGVEGPSNGTEAGSLSTGTTVPESRPSPVAEPIGGRTAPGASPAPAAGLDGSEGELAELRQQMDRMGGVLNRVLERLETPVNEKLLPQVQPVYAALVKTGVEPQLATSICRRIQNKLKKSPNLPVGATAEGLLTKELGPPATIQATADSRRVVVLMGPTGVGKTTTLAKLASFWSLRRGLKVALLTADTYRIAAVEQLRTYCEIIGLPLEVVQEPEEVQPALERHRDANLILVDTAGRSHRNQGHMAELVAYLAALAPDERYLALSLTASNSDAFAVMDAYQEIGYDRLLFTKLDEAAAVGLLLNAVVRSGRPLSYITTGQNVPDDIEVANPERVSRILLGDVT